MGKPGEDTMPTAESICDSRPPVAHGWSWTAVFALSLFIAVPAILILLAAHSVDRRSHPTDEELTASFLAHESEFQTLTLMLDADRRKLPLGAGPFDLADLAAAGMARLDDYRTLLKKINAGNFRYFPRSGNLIVPVSGSDESLAESRKSYLYLSHDEPQPVLNHRGYGWRGPGPYLMTADRPIKGRWFIHHDMTVAVAFAPY
jgi:hypothetical protein